MQANPGKEIEGADIIRSQNIPLYYTYCNFTLKSDQIGQAILYLIGSVFRSILGRGFPCALSEGAAEVVDTGKAAFLRNCGNGKWRVDQQLLGFADSNIQNILLGCNTVMGLELLSQINLADPQAFGKLHIGKGRVLYVLLYIFFNKGQSIRILLVWGYKTIQQLVKGAVNFHPAFITQEHLLQGPKTLDEVLRILQRENRYFPEIQATAGKIDKRKPPFAVGHPAVGTAPGHEDGIVRLADIPFSVQGISNLTAHGKAYAKILTVFHIITRSFGGIHDRWFPNIRDNQFVKRYHLSSPEIIISINNKNINRNRED